MLRFMTFLFSWNLGFYANDNFIRLNVSNISKMHTNRMSSTKMRNVMLSPSTLILFASSLLSKQYVTASAKLTTMMTAIPLHFIYLYLSCVSHVCGWISLMYRGIRTEIVHYLKLQNQKTELLLAQNMNIDKLVINAICRFLRLPNSCLSQKQMNMPRLMLATSRPATKC